MVCLKYAIKFKQIDFTLFFYTLVLNQHFIYCSKLELENHKLINVFAITKGKKVQSLSIAVAMFTNEQDYAKGVGLFI